MGKKSTKLEMQTRVDAVQRMLVNCATRSQINRYAAEAWGANSRSVDELIRRARIQIREDCAVDRNDFMAARLGTLDKIVQETMKTGQFSNTIGALRLSLEVTQVLGGKK